MVMGLMITWGVVRRDNTVDCLGTQLGSEFEVMYKDGHDSLAEENVCTPEMYVNTRALRLSTGISLCDVLNED